MIILPFFVRLIFIAIGVFSITFLIAIHELGHFLFCKLFSISTPSFAVGVGPKLLKKKIGSTLFSLGIFPLGGYVEIAGHEELGQGEQANAFDKGPHSFATKPYYQKLVVVFGGIIFNILFAYITITGILLVQGEKPLLFKNFHMTACIESVADHSPAIQAGLLKDDTIIAINNSIVLHDKGQTLIGYAQAHPGEMAELQIERNGTLLSVPITFGSTKHEGRTVGTCGITLIHNFREPKTIGEAIKQGIALTNMIMYQTINGICMLFKERGKLVSTLSGPIAIIALTTKSATAGLATFLLFLAIISINLAMINLLPIPLFDGGQVVLITLEALVGHKLSQRATRAIKIVQLLTAIILGVLLIYITWHDIIRIVNR